MLAAVSASGVAIFLSLVAGVAGSVQVAVSGAFGKRIGVLEATAFGSRDDERRRCDSTRDVACAVRENPLAFDCLFEARRHWRGSFH